MGKIHETHQKLKAILLTAASSSVLQFKLTKNHLILNEISLFLPLSWDIFLFYDVITSALIRFILNRRQIKPEEFISLYFWQRKQKKNKIKIQIKRTERFISCVSFHTFASLNVLFSWVWHQMSHRLSADFDGSISVPPAIPRAFICLSLTTVCLPDRLAVHSHLEARPCSTH